MTEQHQTAEELPDEVDARFGELETKIEQLEAKRQAYDPGDVARGGAFVILNHDGTIRIERGFIRPEDENPHAETEQEGTDKRRMRRVEGTIQPRAMVKERREKTRRKTENRGCPTRSFETSPRIAPWGCASI